MRIRFRNQHVDILHRPLRRIEDDPQRCGKTIYGAMHLPSRDGLPFVGRLFFPFSPGNLQPLLYILSAKVRLDQPTHAFPDADPDIPKAIVPGIQARPCGGYHSKTE